MTMPEISEGGEVCIPNINTAERLKRLILAAFHGYLGLYSGRVEDFEHAVGDVGVRVVDLEVVHRAVVVLDVLLG